MKWGNKLSICLIGIDFSINNFSINFAAHKEWHFYF